MLHFATYSHFLRLYQAIVMINFKHNSMSTFIIQMLESFMHRKLTLSFLNPFNIGWRAKQPTTLEFTELYEPSTKQAGILIRLIDYLKCLMKKFGLRKKINDRFKKTIFFISNLQIYNIEKLRSSL